AVKAVACEWKQGAPTRRVELIHRLRVAAVEGSFFHRRLRGVERRTATDVPFALEAERLWIPNRRPSYSLVANARHVAGFQRSGRTNGGADAQRLNGRRENRELSRIGLHGRFEPLTARKSIRNRQPAHDVHVVVLLYQ